MKGYYSLVQYAECPERIEYVNIGVVVFSGDGQGVYYKFASKPLRVKKVFGVNLGKHYDLIIESFKSRLSSEFSNWKQVSELDYFIANRSGKLRMTPMKALLLKNPETDVQLLFNRLVSQGQRQQRRQLVKSNLKKRFSSAKVENLLEVPEPININHFSLKADYGYQNGSYNYIKAVSLHGEPNEALNKISVFAVKGRLLADVHSRNEPKQLILVGDDKDQEPSVVEEIGSVLENHSVKFYPLAGMDPLVEDIRKNVQYKN